jgi:hypothetical protein
MALALMYVTLPLGIVGSNLCFPRARTAAHGHRFSLNVENTGAVSVYVFIIAAISVISLVQIYSAGLGFDLIAYFTGAMSQADYRAHRFAFGESTRGLEYYLLGVLPYGLAPTAIVIVWNWSKLDLWVRCAFVGLVTFAVLQSGVKQPWVFIPALLVFSWLMLGSKFSIDRRMLFRMSLVLVFFVIVVLPTLYFLQGEVGFLDGILWGVYRVVFEPQRSLQLFFEVYPSDRDFLYGTSSRLIASLVGVENHVPPSVYTARTILGIDETSFPSLFIGEAWADFGYLGVAFYSVFVGFLLQSYNNWFYASKYHPLEQSATFVAIVITVVHLLENNLFTTFLTFGTVSLFLIYLLIRKPRRHPASSVKLMEGAR